MREGRANGGADGEEGGGADAAAAAAPVGAFRPRKQPKSNPSSSGSAASSSSGGGDAEEKKKQGRRKSKVKREEVVRAIRDRLPAAPSCWGSASVVQGRSRRERPGGVGRDRDAVEQEENDSGAGTAASSPSWCCVCPDGDCSMEANPSANGKEDPAIRSLIELNDFYSDDCNPHAAAAIVESPAADFD